MAYKCFLSFKTEDFDYKKHILEELKVDLVDKSLHESVYLDDEYNFMRKIRKNI